MFLVKFMVFKRKNKKKRIEKMPRVSFGINILSVVVWINVLAYATGSVGLRIEISYL